MTSSATHRSQPANPVFRSAGTLLVGILAAAASACNGSPSAPTPAAMPPSTVGPAGFTVELKGRLVDDVDRPVAGAGVVLRRSHEAGPIYAGQTTTDGNGVFTFTATVQTDEELNGLTIRIDNDGYEGVETWIPPNSDETITIYPTTKIVRGSTLSTRIVASAPYACGFESHRCRRIVVEPAGEAVVVEILETDGEDVGLVDDEPPLLPFAYERRVTISDGQAYIIGGPARVTLRASAVTDPLPGQYTLTLSHGCTEVPEEARTRTYAASIDSTTSGYQVTLSDAKFLTGPICTMTASGLGCHQFLASRAGDRVRFDLINADEWHGGYVTEQIPQDGTWLQVFGSATGHWDGGGTMTAVGSGGVWYCSASSGYPFPCHSVKACDVTDLRLSFVRR